MCSDMFKTSENCETIEAKIIKLVFQLELSLVKLAMTVTEVSQGGCYGTVARSQLSKRE